MISRKEDQFISPNNNFVWFTGIVEDVSDPLYMNRVRVRCIGYHTTDKGVLPTDKLPWATVMMGNDVASVAGVGKNHSCRVDSWILGFFRDGKSAQDPIILGTITSSTGGVSDIPPEAHVDGNTNHVHRTEAGHLIEYDNTPDNNRINITHSSGTTININNAGDVEINSVSDVVSIDGNTTITGTLHVTEATTCEKEITAKSEGDESVTLTGHTHTEVPGTGGASSPTPSTAQTTKPKAGT